MDLAASERTQEGVADGELLAGMRAGNSAAFAALMRSNNQRLYRLERGFLKDDAQAEEAVHDGYVNAFTHLDGFKGGSSLATWLARIVSNEALARLRRRRPTLDIGENARSYRGRSFRRAGASSSSSPPYGDCFPPERPVSDGRPGVAMTVANGVIARSGATKQSRRGAGGSPIARCC